jgi:hypothetical protein
MALGFQLADGGLLAEAAGHGQERLFFGSLAAYMNPSK